MKNIFTLVLMIILSLTVLSCGGESTVKYNGPTVQTAEELAKLKAREKEELTTYKILDAEKGIYQIPVDSAMKIISSDKSSDIDFK